MDENEIVTPPVDAPSEAENFEVVEAPEVAPAEPSADAVKSHNEVDPA